MGSNILFTASQAYTQNVVFQVFPPALSDLPPPMLDLFDLDETFSSEKVRLAQLTNKCRFCTSLSQTGLGPTLFDHWKLTFLENSFQWGGCLETQFSVCKGGQAETMM